MTISFDNANNNGSAIEWLRHELPLILDRQLFHNRCVCHILNLCVHNGLKICNEALAKIRGVLALIRSSESRSREWKQLVNGFNLHIENFQQMFKVGGIQLICCYKKLNHIDNNLNYFGIGK